MNLHNVEEKNNAITLLSLTFVCISTIEKIPERHPTNADGLCFKYLLPEQL